MKKLLLFAIVISIISCKQKEKLTAQQIIDKAIEVSGGELYTTSEISFDFRKIKYMLSYVSNRKQLKRIFKKDGAIVKDVLAANKLQRFVNDSLIQVPDSMAVKYVNSVNSVHYFVYLPYGLNDGAVKKKLLGEVIIKEKPYYKIKVTFAKEGGGVDYDDTYIYWFNKETFKPDYLAYEYHVGKGGIRFREAYNERFVEGIRFVDYYNLKPKSNTISILDIDELYSNGNLELLSKIELENVQVNKEISQF